MGQGSFQPDGYHEAISSLATAVTVITFSTGPGNDARAGRRLGGMTASAVCSLSMEPRQLLVCIRHGIRTHEALEGGAAFAVNVLGQGQAHLALRFASAAPDRFRGVNVRQSRGVPLLKDAIAHFICDVGERFPGGDHTIFVGEVLEHRHCAEARPLLHFARRFEALEDPESGLLRSWLEGAASS
jgi:flavin reductase (DIM6/NTAB) family NADH-FMN oxidoreductase RutF